MGSGFDVRTAFMLLGVLAAASALGGYATLRPSLHRGNLLWLISGGCFGAGGVLLALRGAIPDLLSFELAHGALVGGLAGQALAIHQEGRPRLRQGGRTLLLAVVLPLVSVGVFAVVRRVDVVWGVAYFALAVGVGCVAVVVTALRLWRSSGQRGAAIVALTFGVLAAAMVGRIASVLYRSSSEPAFEPGLNQMFMLVAGYLTLVLGQVGYLGMQFERIAKGRVATAREAAILAERARQTQLREEALRDLLEERNQLIQSLARHESASGLSRFAMDRPHELSQPLCASKLNLESVLARAEGGGFDPGVLGALRSIDSSNDRLEQQLQQLRILLATHDASDHRPIELEPWVRRTLPILEGSFRDQSVALEVLPCADPVWALASPTQLQQLTLILCTNALLHLAPRERRAPAWVRVSVGREGDEAWLLVEDAGPEQSPGAPALERINLGLAIATRIAQAHRGRLESRDGARAGSMAFRLSLPAIAPPQ